MFFSESLFIVQSAFSVKQSRNRERHNTTSMLKLLFFSVLMQRLANTKAHTSRFISANLPCNKFKNRLVNIMPYESTRVCLQPIRGVEGSDYINASFIDGYRLVLINCHVVLSIHITLTLHCADFNTPSHHVINAFPQATESLHRHAGTTGRDHRGLLENALGTQFYYCCYAHKAQRNGQGMNTLIFFSLLFGKFTFLF